MAYGGLLVMEYKVESALTNFDFWAGAREHKFTYSELDELEHAIEELYPDGCTDTNINDLFWFEEELLCSFIGVDYEEDYLER